VAHTIEELERTARDEIPAAGDLPAVEDLRRRWLGKSGLLQEVLRGIGALPAEKRGPVGKAANELKAWIEAELLRVESTLRTAQEGAIGDAEWVDATLPGERRGGGLVHPVAQMRRELEDVCLSMGFEVLDGPWVEDERHNFEALNIPKDHPARDSQDTFWFPDGRCLRTHTSPVQIRAMETRTPPIRVVSIGRVFRNEALDAGHENTFHQIEGFLVDRDVTVGHLVHTLRTLLSEAFQRSVEVRLRPSFFPFTEPSFEMDVRCLVCSGTGCPVCKRTGWVELLGCGLVHPAVLKAGGIDPSQWSGFAFGLGVDRVLMMRHRIEDIRRLMAGELSFLRKFATGVEG
jgi:phenylalanyl-tRNA synthetase alpha chain